MTLSGLILWRTGSTWLTAWHGSGSKKVPAVTETSLEQARLSLYVSSNVSSNGLTLARVVEAPPRSSRALVIKRGLDILIAGAVLIAVAPLLALIALAIRLDSPGPVLFRQERAGKDGRTFVMLKFRTMVADRRRRAVGVPAGVRERRRRHKSP